jgi:hypothetical protein
MIDRQPEVNALGGTTMKHIRATISILTLAAASSLMTDAIAANCSATKQYEHSPFVIGFVTEGDGTKLNVVIYPYENGKLGAALKDDALLNGALTVNGQRCGHRAIAVNRFWNHELYYTIEIMPGVYMKIPIPH